MKLPHTNTTHTLQNIHQLTYNTKPNIIKFLLTHNLFTLIYQLKLSLNIINETTLYIQIIMAFRTLNPWNKTPIINTKGINTKWLVEIRRRQHKTPISPHHTKHNIINTSINTNHYNPHHYFNQRYHLHPHNHNSLIHHIHLINPYNKPYQLNPHYYSNNHYHSYHQSKYTHTNTNLSFCYTNHTFIHNTHNSNSLLILIITIQINNHIKSPSTHTLHTTIFYQFHFITNTLYTLHSIYLPILFHNTPLL